jgi:hypothetical protein
MYNSPTEHRITEHNMTEHKICTSSNVHRIRKYRMTEVVRPKVENNLNLKYIYI